MTLRLLTPIGSGQSGVDQENGQVIERGRIMNNDKSGRNRRSRGIKYLIHSHTNSNPANQAPVTSCAL